MESIAVSGNREMTATSGTGRRFFKLWIGEEGRGKGQAPVELVG